MKKPELYHKTVDILVQAYFNDTLEHGDYCGCAVGNLIAAHNGIEIIRTVNDIHWGAQSPLGMGWYAFKDEPNKMPIDVRKAIKKTGYSFKEIYIIERAFENAEGGESDDEWMFNGLMAVIEVLDQIHENTDTEVTKVTKQKFVRA